MQERSVPPLLLLTVLKFEYSEHKTVRDRPRQPPWHQRRSAPLLPLLPTTPTRLFVTVEQTNDLPTYRFFPRSQLLLYRRPTIFTDQRLATGNCRLSCSDKPGQEWRSAGEGCVKKHARGITLRINKGRPHERVRE
ncbi:hypothetical protein CBL_04083 [Carabus blaptoides fortunei]